MIYNNRNICLLVMSIKKCIHFRKKNEKSCCRINFAGAGDLMKPQTFDIQWWTGVQEHVCWVLTNSLKVSTALFIHCHSTLLFNSIEYDQIAVDFLSLFWGKSQRHLDAQRLEALLSDNWVNSSLIFVPEYKKRIIKIVILCVFLSFKNIPRTGAPV